MVSETVGGQQRQNESPMLSMAEKSKAKIKFFLLTIVTVALGIARFLTHWFRKTIQRIVRLVPPLHPVLAQMATAINS